METTNKGRVVWGTLITFTISLLAFQAQLGARSEADTELLTNNNDIPVFSDQYQLKSYSLVDGKYELRSESNNIDYHTDLGDYLSISNYRSFYEDDQTQEKYVNMSLVDENGNYKDYQSQKKEINHSLTQEEIASESFGLGLGNFYNENYYQETIICIDKPEHQGFDMLIFTDIPKNTPQNYSIFGEFDRSAYYDYYENPEYQEESEEAQKYLDDYNNKYANYYQELDKFYAISDYSRYLNIETLEPIDPIQKFVLKFKIYGLMEDLKNSEYLSYELREENGEKYHVFSIPEVHPTSKSNLEPFVEKTPYLESYFNTKNYHQEKDIHYGENWKDEFVRGKIKETGKSREEIFDPAKYESEEYEMVEIEMYDAFPAPNVDYYTADEGCYDFETKLSDAEAKKLLEQLPKTYELEKEEYLKELVEPYL